MMTDTQQAVLDWASGRKSASEVTALLKRVKGVPEPLTLEQRMSRLETDDGPDLNLDGWGGVEVLYATGQLTKQQFERLYKLTAPV